ncbi:MAG: hypothetical protein N4A64_10835 [Marinisporobacter sp.]|jgi:hypothetical protein|nr:hypothetical protein [Marinisporobacter sp.]
MSKEEKIKAGYWSVATQKHLKEFTTYSTNLDEVDNLNIAGKSGRFLGAIRGNTKIQNIKKLEKMANNVGISKNELHLIILPKIEKASDKQVELIKNSTGEITGIAEYLFTNNSVLEIAGEVFENQNPSNLERIAIETMDETKRIPYLEREIMEILIKNGFREEDLKLSLALQEHFKLIKRLNKTKSKDPIISNEYVWGYNHQKIAMAVSSIDFGRKQTLKEVIEIVQNSQGYPVEKLPCADKELLLLAKKVGMLNPTAIKSSRGIQKEFAFSPNMLEPLTYHDDILDDVKLLLASIRFGENYTPHSTINDPVSFLEYLIKYGDIGPHDANSTDYTLLEKKGIVNVVHKTKQKWSSYYGHYYTKSGYCLELVRKDVAIEALKVIKNSDYKLKIDSEINSFEPVNDTGTFISSEEFRLKFGESPEPMQEMEDHFNKVLRDELL